MSARIRITVTGGVGPLGSDKGNVKDTVLIAAGPMPGHAETGSVVVVPWTRNTGSPLAGVKSTSYGENVVALLHAKQQGANEAIFANTEGQLCEGTGSNVFLVHEGDLVTPPLESGCLAGITREITLDLCNRLGIPVQERDVPVDALVDAPEAFLTSTLREIQPIALVDGNPLPNCPGQITAELRAAFRSLVQTQIDP